MRILYRNFIEQASLTASSYKTNRDESMLKHIHLTRSFSFGESAGNIVIDFGEVKDINAFALGGTNLLRGDSIILEGNNSNDWGTPQFSETIRWCPDHQILFLSESFRYWRINIASEAAEVEIGHIFIGTFLQLPGIIPNMDFEHNRSDTLTLNTNLNVYGDKGVKSFSAKFKFPYIKENSVTILGKIVATRQEIIDMWNEVGTVIPVYLCIWEEDLLSQPAIYGVIQQPNTVMKRDIESHSYSCEIVFQETR